MIPNYEEDQWGMEKCFNFALLYWMHPMAHISCYLSICWACSNLHWSLQLVKHWPHPHLSRNC